MKRAATLIVLIVALVAASQANAGTDDQARITSGDYAMSASEVQSLVGAAQYAQSVEGQTGVLTSPGTVDSASTRTHCYGHVYWKAGENAVGNTVWKEWNHTAWCGVPYDHIVMSSVQGHTDVYTSVSWDVSDKSWTQFRDNVHPKKGHYTRGSAVFKQCAGPACITSETINTTMHIFANGAWDGS